MADGDEKCGQHLVQVDGWAARLGLAPPRPRMPAPPPPPLLSPPFLIYPTRWLGAVNVCAARAQGLHAGAPALRSLHTCCRASARRAHVRVTCAHDPARLHRPTFPTLLWQPTLLDRKLEPRVGPGIDSTVGRGVLPHARPAGGLPLPGSWLTPRRWRWLLATCRCAARWLCEGVDPCGQREEGGAGAVCGDAVGCRWGFC